MGITFRTGHKSESDGFGMGARLFCALFGMIFLVAGIAFLRMVGQEVLSTAATYQWRATLCKVLESYVEDRGGGESPFLFRITYEYTVTGNPYTSSAYSQQLPEFSQYGKAHQLTVRYAADSEIECFVNPRNLSEAVIKRRSLWSVLMLLFPLPFVLFGGFALALAWYGGGGQSEKKRSISQTAKRSGGIAAKIGLRLFLSIFIIVGALVGYFLGLKPLVKNHAAQGWVENEALVERSSVQAHKGDDSTSYSADILYSYQFGGHSYKSSNYSFLGIQGSYRAARAIVDRYPPGAVFSCRVNPDLPWESVVSTELQAQALIPAAVGLIFILLGSGAFWAVGRDNTGSRPTAPRPALGQVPPHKPVGSAAERSQESVETLLDLRSAPQKLPSGEYLLVSLIGGKEKFGCVTVFALVWNLIIFFVGYDLLAGLFRGEPEVISLLLFSPFLLVGIVLVGAVVYFALALRNARPMLYLSRPYAKIGEKFAFRWELSGKTVSLSRLSITLKGFEEAKYRRGTSDYTDRDTFFEQELICLHGYSAAAEGRAEVVIPANTMHSFTAPNNKIIWQIRVHGSIERWPDINEDFSLSVLP